MTASAPLRVVWFHRDVTPPRWCVLRAASPAGRVTTLCLDSLDYAPVCVRTDRPGHACPACEAELAAGTPGAAVAVDPKDGAPADASEIDSGRVPTLDLRRPAAESPAVAAWDSWWASARGEAEHPGPDRRPDVDPAAAWDAPEWDPPSAAPARDE